MKWQPIETAPKDGSNILGYESGVIAPMAWAPEKAASLAGWRLEWLYWADESTRAEPTHWMPLPEPPK